VGQGQVHHSLLGCSVAECLNCAPHTREVAPPALTTSNPLPVPTPTDQVTILPVNFYKRFLIVFCYENAFLTFLFLQRFSFLMHWEWSV